MNQKFENLDEYKHYISNIMNRLIKEKRIEILENYENDQISYKIQILHTEWYLELDEDTQYNVQVNLANYFKPLIKESIEEAKIDNFNKLKHKKRRTE